MVAGATNIFTNTSVYDNVKMSLWWYYILLDVSYFDILEGLNKAVNSIYFGFSFANEIILCLNG